MNRHRILTFVVLCMCAIFWLLRPQPVAFVSGSAIWEPTENVGQIAQNLPWVGAKGAALMDVSSYRLLAGKNLHQRLPMASTTKIMTALLAIESGRLQEIVTVSADACKVEPSSIWLVPGEKIKLDDLVYGLMLRSGNDAAQAIAEFLGGTIESFATQMNAKATELGLQDTNFVNPHGLPNPNHYTSAYDLAKIAAYALRNPKFADVVSTKRISLPWDQHDEPRVWYNKNRLLSIYPGADGVKTGWTRAAGYCLVASANRAGLRVVAVVLNSPDDFGETAQMMDYAFANFQPTTMVTKGQFLRSLMVQNGYPRYIGVMTAEGYTWPQRVGETLALDQEVILPEQLTAPVIAGQRLGTLRVLQAEQCLAEIPLVADQLSDRGWWQQSLRRAAGCFWRLIDLATWRAES